MTAPMSFFARPPPLGDSRAVPTPSAPTAKRMLGGPLPVAKRVKVNTAKSSHAKSHKLLIPPHRAITPEASSDGAEPSSDIDLHPAATHHHAHLHIDNDTDHGYTSLHPAMNRIRAPPTPTTSTVAASSSPSRRLAMSPVSSPRASASTSASAAAYRSKSRTTSPAVPVLLDASATLVFGRHRHQPKTQPHDAPAALVPRLQHPARPARTIGLDRAARHASRVHAAAEMVETQWGGSLVRLVVLGQNGVRVRHGANPRRRLRCGAVAEFTTDEPLEIDFYGAAVLVSAAEEFRDADARERLFTPEPQVMPAFQAQSPMSLPPSSPPMLMDHLEHMEDDEQEHSDIEAEEEHGVIDSIPIKEKHEEKEEPAHEIHNSAPEPAADAFSRSSSPLSDPEDDVEVAAPAAGPSTPAAAPTPKNLSTHPAAAPSPKAATAAAAASTNPAARAVTPKPSKSRAATPAVEIPPFPATLDLAALLASTVVFSGSSKLSLPDLVKHMLESQPALRDHGDDKVWSAWAAAELDTNPMFGKVARNGKDVSGRPLLPHYYYNPASDPDPARAKELGGLVRPLRAAQRTGGKVIDWRPVGSGRRRYY